MGERRAPTQISGVSPSNRFLLRAITFLWKQTASLDSRDLVAPTRRHTLGTSVHFSVQEFTEMLSASILWQALSRALGRGMCKQLTCSWEV